MDRNALRALIPDETRLRFGEDIAPEYLSDTLGRLRGKASALVFVRSTEEVSAVMKYAYARNIPVTPRGAGTNLVGSTVPLDGGIILDLSQMNRVLELDEDTPVLILEDDLYQIVFNLMENGIKYNLPGGTLTVHLGRQEDNAVLTVSDTGMGIPEDALAHIFERFYRVDKARSRKSGGSGLGLAIVRTIVQRNRGEISVSSTVGKGSVFTVTFPAFDTEVDKS